MPNSSCHFWKHKSFYLQILHQYSVSSEATTLYVFSLKILYFDQKQLIKVQIFEIVECPDQNLPKSSCHFPNHKEFFLQIFHDSSMSSKITPQYFFRSNIIYFAQKGPIKVQILETFECLDQNSPNSCQFWNKKLVFVQILHQSSVSWGITPLYFFWLKLYLLFNKRSLTRYKFGEIHLSSWKFFFKFWTLMGSFCKNHVKFQPRKYRRIISHDIEEWCKV